MPFANDILGGVARLIRSAIQSPNFSAANQTGWAINKDGSAQFFNITAAGGISGGTLIIDNATGGVFLYSGAPAGGNLIGSFAQSAGTDSFGNSYPPGIAIGPAGSNTEIQIRPDLGAIFIYSA